LEAAIGATDGLAATAAAAAIRVGVAVDARLESLIESHIPRPDTAVTAESSSFTCLLW
jgi:hypothetical protein